ncbi:MAG TPA: matrixin family metalloprotease [Candidatus Paceibacterota bacterium]|nr:matrixin family metalloprotease [Candidatus Paceibacterota bacterium]
MKTLGIHAAKIVGAIALLGSVAYGANYLLAETPLTPACSEPITYAITDIDPRFGVTEEELEDVLKEAAALWNTAAGKTVLVENEGAELPIRLVYDERQATSQLGDVISIEQQNYDQKKAEVDALIAAHESDINAYELRLAQFEAKEQAYEADVARWNSQGGAPPAEFERLENRRRALEREQVSLNAQAARLNATVQDINTGVAQLNAFAEKLNSKVNVYNEFAGHDFDQGQYVEDENGKRITIYEFEDRTQLLRALAHEFGHALGIAHTEDPQSLMYPYNSGKSLLLAADDIAALKQACDL